MSSYNFPKNRLTVPLSVKHLGSSLRVSSFLSPLTTLSFGRVSFVSFFDFA